MKNLSNYIFEAIKIGKHNKITKYVTPELMYKLLCLNPDNSHKEDFIELFKNKLELFEPIEIDEVKIYLPRYLDEPDKYKNMVINLDYFPEEYEHLYEFNDNRTYMNYYTEGRNPSDYSNDDCAPNKNIKNPDELCVVDYAHIFKTWAHHTYFTILILPNKKLL